MGLDLTFYELENYNTEKTHKKPKDRCFFYNISW